ncbi:MAG: hypothetical protein KC549_04640, partial [Myxococcales bacterium]|nr:hypothetical protein [Myxococcales bacterium]
PPLPPPPHYTPPPVALLLAAGRLRAAVEGVAAIGAVVPVRGDLTWAVRSRSRLQDLVKYALSESHHQVRHALGLAI